MFAAWMFVLPLSLALGADAAPSVDAEELEKLKASLLADTAMPSKTDAGAVAPMQSAGALPRGGLQDMNPDVSAILDIAGATYNTREPLQLGEHDPQQPGFTLQQLEVSFTANVDPFFRVDTHIVYRSHGVELEEAYGTTLALPANLQVRAGQFLNRIGRINPLHPHQWHFVDQPLVIGKYFGGDGDRNVGFEASWLSILPWFAEFMVAATNSGGLSYHQDPLAFDTLGDVLWTGTLKQFFPLSEDVSLLWGLTGQTATNAYDGRTTLYGTDLYLRYRPLDSDTRHSLSLQIETLARHRTLYGFQTLDDWGGYAEVIWSMNQSFESGLRAEYVSGVADDPLAEDWTKGRDRYSAQLTYYPTHFSRVRVQASAGKPGWLDDWIYGAVLALEVVAGAHGAHYY